MQQHQTGYSQDERLPIGQRVVIITPYNNAGLPRGAMGTIVDHQWRLPDGTERGTDYFWGEWGEQFVLLDAGVPDNDGEPVRIRRAHLAMVDPSRHGALAAMKRIRFRLNVTTRQVLDRLLCGDPIEDHDLDDVEEEATRVWVESGRRKTTTKRLAAHEAVEHFLRGDFDRALKAAQFGAPPARTRRAARAMRHSPASWRRSS